MAGLRLVRQNLRYVYRQLSLGGDADLDILCHTEPYGDGIAYYIRPPLKVWKCVSELSGGERTIASLSLVLALQRFGKSPLIVVDEVDAALDCRNVSILSRYFGDQKRSCQFVVVTLRVYMYSLADRLFGVCKVGSGATLSLFF